MWGRVALLEDWIGTSQKLERPYCLFLTPGRYDTARGAAAGTSSTTFLPPTTRHAASRKFHEPAWIEVHVHADSWNFDEDGPRLPRGFRRGRRNFWTHVVYEKPYDDIGRLETVRNWDAGDFCQPPPRAMLTCVQEPDSDRTSNELSPAPKWTVSFALRVPHSVTGDFAHWFNVVGEAGGGGPHEHIVGPQEDMLLEVVS